MHERIGEWLRECRELAEFCTQNGWIDNDSLEFDVRCLGDDVEVAVKFSEVVMKGAGCEGRRIPCFARLRLRLGRSGEVLGARAL